MTAQIYYNLRTGLWSVRSGGRVIAHLAELTLGGCVPHVGESSRQKVIERRCRSVHAWIKGSAWSEGASIPPGAERVSYNPYRCGYFTFADGTAYTGGDRAWFDAAGRMWAVR